MGSSFIACDGEQSFLMPPDVREWLPENHVAWFVLAAVEEMDLSAFYAAYGVDGKSRPAYEPAMVVALLLYAYARGVRSSRVIERACVEDVAFRVVAAQQRPDHATIARFIERHEAALAGLFGEVLLLCARSGLANVGVIAVDGTKVQANASRDANVDYEQLAREVIQEAKAIDAAEDELYGDRRGDELPEELSTSQGRRGWLREAKRRLEAERDRSPRPVPRSRPKRVRARPGWTGGYYAFMRRVLAGERGSELYRRRQPMIEPVFGHTKHNRGMGRFQRRGRGAVRAEWRLITATHNPLKLHRHGLAAT
jgi:transposase